MDYVKIASYGSDESLEDATRAEDRGRFERKHAKYASDVYLPEAYRYYADTEHDRSSTGCRTDRVLELSEREPQEHGKPPASPHGATSEGKEGGTRAKDKGQTHEYESAKTKDRASVKGKDHGEEKAKDESARAKPTKSAKLPKKITKLDDLHSKVKIPEKYLEKLFNPSDSASKIEEIELYHSAQIESTIGDNSSAIDIKTKIAGLEPARNVQQQVDPSSTHKTAHLKGDESIHGRLYNACIMGDLSTLKGILDEHYETLMPDEQGQTPLFPACMGNQPEIVEYLVDRGYIVDHQDNDGKTPLHIALECGEFEIAHLLSNKFRANYKLRDARNWTPFHYAVDQGCYSVCPKLMKNFLQQDANSDVSWLQLIAACYEVNVAAVEFLLATNADVNHISSCGHTALHIACARGNLDIIKLLLQHGAQETINEPEGENHLTPLHTACDKGHASVVELLLEYGANPNALTARIRTPCSAAVLTGNTEALRCLLQCPDVDLQVVDSDGDTCLHDAVRKGNLEIITLLLEHGADPNAGDKDGDNCLQLALHNRKNDVVPILIKAGMDAGATDKDGDTCLQLAVYAQCSVETLRLLLENGAPLNHRNKRGYTALLIAGDKCSHEVIELLLSYGCDPNIPNEDGVVVLHLVIRRRCDARTLQALIDRGANVNILHNKVYNPLLYACRKNYPEAISVLLQAKPDLSLADQDGDTALHNAILQGVSQDIIHEIIRHCQQADLDAVNNDGESALMLACRKCQNHTVALLLQAGASTELYDKDSDTCLHNAVRKGCSTETVQALLDHGAPLDAINTRGNTALIVAFAYGSISLFRLLLERGADPNISDWDDDTSLHLACLTACEPTACKETNMTKAALLLKHGADPKKRNDEGHEPLYYAIRGQRPEFLEVFFNHDPSTLDMTLTPCMTALHKCCSEGKWEMVKWLLEHGVDKDRVCEKETPIEIALSRGHKNIVYTLLDAGANVSLTAERTGFVGRIYQQRHRHMDILQHIITQNCNVDFTARDAAQETLLFKACRDNDRKVVQMLVDSKRDIGINLCNSQGQSPVWITCANAGNCDALSILHFLLRNKQADVDLADHSQTTPLHLVCQEDRATMVTLIVNTSDKSVNARDAKGRTPLQLATGQDVINLLVRFGAKEE